MPPSVPGADTTRVEQGFGLNRVRIDLTKSLLEVPTELLSSEYGTCKIVKARVRLG